MRSFDPQSINLSADNQISIREKNMVITIPFVDPKKPFQILEPGRLLF